MQLSAHALHTASTFEGLAALYGRLPRLRSPSMANARSLSCHGKPYVTLRPVKLPDAHGWAARYHHTDVVTWLRATLPEGGTRETVTVRGWRSHSTETFADAYTPWCLRFKLRLDDGFYVRVAMSRAGKHDDQARCYEFNSAITFAQTGDGVWLPVEGAVETSFIDVRSPLLRAALTKTNYFAFMDYARARLALHNACISAAMMRPNNLTPDLTMSLLADPDKWDDLLFSVTFMSARTKHSHTAWLDEVSTRVRAVIYQHEKAVPVREVEWYPWSQFETQRKLRARYPWSVY